jgi:hypothetical protein
MGSCISRNNDVNETFQFNNPNVAANDFEDDYDLFEVYDSDQDSNNLIEEEDRYW